MNILLLGGGGREHALAWKLAQSPRLDTLYAAPGNPGIAEQATLVDLDATDHRSVLDFCTRHSIGLVVIGPEAPLVDGLADNLRTMGVPVFGPNKKAAQLEGSKGFTKDLCQRAHIPTAAYQRVTSKDGAIAALDDFTLPVVIKADGLAAGKGVIIAETRQEALDALDTMFSGAFGAAGEEVVLEEFMTGEEASFFALTDGTAILPFGSAQDHKRVGDGDTGPNTGGMGAYSPAPVLTPALEAQVMREIVQPTVDTMAADGIPYVGVLYAGLMLTKAGPQLIEYNARFGDPECQVLMLRMKSDIVPVLLAAVDGDLDHVSVQWHDAPALTLVMAAEGYPGTPKKGTVIEGTETAAGEGVVIFHAGTARNGEGRLVANGGRVLNVTATGQNVREARDRAYAAAEKIRWREGFYRSDIGWRAIAREE